MKKAKANGHTGHERRAAKDVRELLQDAYDEQIHRKNPKAALAFLGVAETLPRVLEHAAGWSGAGNTDLGRRFNPKMEKS